MTPEQELLSAIDDEKRALREEPAWQTGPSRLFMLVKTALKVRAAMNFTTRGELLPWEGILDFLVKWHHEMPLGDGACDEDMASGVGLRAVAFCRYSHIEAGVHRRYYRVRRKGSTLMVTQQWDGAQIVADMIFDERERSVEFPEPSQAEIDWLGSDYDQGSLLPPFEVARDAATRARIALEDCRLGQIDGSLPADFPLGEGITVSETLDVLALLSGLATLAEMTSARPTAAATLFQLPRAYFADMLGAVYPEIPQDRLRAIADRLTYRPGRSVRTTPLIPFEDRLLLCPPLLTPRAMDAIALRTAAADSQRFRPSGRLLGDRARAWTQLFRRVPGALVTERVRVRGDDGRDAGDLDVLVVDPRERTGLCVEVKWPIDAVTYEDDDKVEQWIVKAARQAAALREKIERGSAVPELPAGWPPFDSIEWTWAVGTPRNMSARPIVELVPGTWATSLRYLTLHGTPSDLAEVIDAVTDPDLPRRGVHFEVDRLTFPVGRESVTLEGLALLPRARGWQPGYRPSATAP